MSKKNANKRKQQRARVIGDCFQFICEAILSKPREQIVNIVYCYDCGRAKDILMWVDASVAPPAINGVVVATAGRIQVFRREDNASVGIMLERVHDYADKLAPGSVVQASRLMVDDLIDMLTTLLPVQVEAERDAGETDCAHRWVVGWDGESLDDSDVCSRCDESRPLTTSKQRDEDSAEYLSRYPEADSGDPTGIQWPEHWSPDAGWPDTSDPKWKRIDDELRKQGTSLQEQIDQLKGDSN